ncbi:MAG TPA: NAD-binding protein [Thermodesulfovibrionales bacterium]|nr:NAD-binding protein [Thermodesulfovibrionales bacterium]
MNSGDQRNLNLPLQLSRFLAPALLAWATIKAIWILLKAKYSFVKLHRLKNHVVICGANKNTHSLFEDLINEERNIIIIDKAIEEPLSNRFKEEGAIVIEDDARSKTVLDKAGVLRCSRLIIMTPNDAMNTEIALTAMNMVKNSGVHSGRTIDSAIHIVDSRYAELIRKSLDRLVFDNIKLGRSANILQVRTFNLYENSARLLFERMPLFKSVDSITSHDARPVHLLIIGLGHMGENVLLQAAKIGHFPNQITMKITVVDREEKEIAFKERYPLIDRAVDVDFKKIDTTTKAFNDLLQEMKNSITYAVVCLDNDEMAKNTADKLIHHLPNIPIAVRMTENLLIAEWLEQSMEEYERVFCFGAPQQSASRHAFLNPIIDKMAEANHQVYSFVCSHIKELKKGEKKLSDLFDSLKQKENVVEEWYKLISFEKSSNHAQAEHITTKLHAVGLLRCLEEEIPQDYKKISASEAENIINEYDKLPDELLSMTEHTRWNAFYFIDGWQKMEPMKPPDNDVSKIHKDTKSKNHSCLVDWSQLEDVSNKVSKIRSDILSEIETKKQGKPVKVKVKVDFKAYDEWHVRSIPYVLDLAGYVVCKKRGAGR